MFELWEKTWVPQENPKHKNKSMQTPCKKFEFGPKTFFSEDLKQWGLDILFYHP